MSKSIVFVYWLTFLCCIQLRGQAPCDRSAEWLDRLAYITDSELPNESKITILEKDLHAAKACPATPDSVRARLVHRLADLYRWQSDLPKAMAYCHEAIALNRGGSTTAEPAFLTNSYYNLGIYYSMLSDREAALNAYDSSIWFGRKYGSKHYIALMAYEQKAFSFFNGGDFQECMDICNQGIAFSKNLQDTLYEAILRLQLAQAQLRTSLIEPARANVLFGIDVLKKDKENAGYLATGYAIYAALLRESTDYHKATKNFETAFFINKAIKNWPQCARDLIDLGFVYDKYLNDTTKAINAYAKALTYSREASDAYLEAGINTNIGVMFWRRSNYRQALSFYQKALAALPISFRDESWTSNPKIDRLLATSNDYYLLTLLSNKGEALSELYGQEKKKEWLTASIQTYELADKIIDKMRWNQQSDQSKLFWRQQTRSMYEKAIAACEAVDDKEKAFYFMEKSRAVLLNDRLSIINARRQLTPGILAREDYLLNNTIQLQQQLLSLSPDKNEYNDVYQTLFTNQKEREKFVKLLEQKYPVYHHLKYANNITSLAKFTDILKRRKASLVQYFTGDSVIYAIAITPSGTMLKRIPYPEFRSDAKQLLNLSSDYGSINARYAQFAALAHRIYAKIFEPLNIPPGPVIVSPDEDFIPFEALIPNADQPQRFLIADYTFSYAYSTSLLLRQSDHTSKTADGLLAVAPVTFQPGLRQQALPGAETSLGNIRKLLPSMNMALHEKASRALFLHQFPRYSIVQLYSHAYADSSGSDPIIYLYDSTIALSEIQGHTAMQTQLIVLSACQTGTGKVAKGEGIFSLARGFYAAGIPSLITTLWPVDNQATYAITELFYKYLQQGKPKDEALRDAKLEYMNSGDKTKMLPYLWASAILIGNADAIQIRQHKNNSMIYFMIGSVAIAGILLLLRRRLHTRR